MVFTVLRKERRPRSVCTLALFHCLGQCKKLIHWTKPYVGNIPGQCTLSKCFGIIFISSFCTSFCPHNWLEKTHMYLYKKQCKNVMFLCLCVHRPSEGQDSRLRKWHMWGKMYSRQMKKIILFWNTLWGEIGKILENWFPNLVTPTNYLESILLSPEYVTGTSAWHLSQHQGSSLAHIPASLPSTPLQHTVFCLLWNFLAPPIPKAMFTPHYYSGELMFFLSLGHLHILCFTS